MCVSSLFYHLLGCGALCWAPSTETGSWSPPSQPLKNRLMRLGYVLCTWVCCSFARPISGKWNELLMRRESFFPKWVSWSCKYRTAIHLHAGSSCSTSIATFLMRNVDVLCANVISLLLNVFCHAPLLSPNNPTLQHESLTPRTSSGSCRRLRGFSIPKRYLMVMTLPRMQSQ